MRTQKETAARCRSRDGGNSEINSSPIYARADPYANEDCAIAWLRAHSDLTQAEQFEAVTSRFGLDTIEAMCAMHAAVQEVQQ